MDGEEGGWPSLSGWGAISLDGSAEALPGDVFEGVETILRLVAELERLDRQLEMVDRGQIGKHFADMRARRRTLDALFAEARRWTLGS